MTKQSYLSHSEWQKTHQFGADRWCKNCDLGQFFFVYESWKTYFVSGLPTGSTVKYFYECNKCHISRGSTLKEEFKKYRNIFI